MRPAGPSPRRWRCPAGRGAGGPDRSRARCGLWSRRAPRGPSRARCGGRTRALTPPACFNVTQLAAPGGVAALGAPAVSSAVSGAGAAGALTLNTSLGALRGSERVSLAVAAGAQAGESGSGLVSSEPLPRLGWGCRSGRRQWSCQRPPPRQMALAWGSAREYARVRIFSCSPSPPAVSGRPSTCRWLARLRAARRGAGRRPEPGRRAGRRQRVLPSCWLAGAGPGGERDGQRGGVNHPGAAPRRGGQRARGRRARRVHAAPPPCSRRASAVFTLRIRRLTLRLLPCSR
jgi:hypothetical protein